MAAVLSRHFFNILFFNSSIFNILFCNSSNNSFILYCSNELVFNNSLTDVPPKIAIFLSLSLFGNDFPFSHRITVFLLTPNSSPNLACVNFLFFSYFLYFFSDNNINVQFKFTPFQLGVLTLVNICITAFLSCHHLFF